MGRWPERTPGPTPRRCPVMATAGERRLGRRAPLLVEVGGLGRYVRDGGAVLQHSPVSRLQGSSWGVSLSCGCITSSDRQPVTTDSTVAFVRLCRCAPGSDRSMVGEPFHVPVAGGGHRIHNAAFDWFDILAALGSLAPLSTGRPQPPGTRRRRPAAPRDHAGDWSLMSGLIAGRRQRCSTEGMLTGNLRIRGQMDIG